MQQQPVRSYAYRPSVAAWIGGRQVEASRVSIERDLPDPLERSGLTAASGSVTADSGTDAVSTVTTPWNPQSQWPPIPETDATIMMDMGAGPVSLLTNGRTKAATGGTDGREVSVELSDRYQTLERRISWDAAAAAMPSETAGARSRFVSMYTSAITDRILRHCGWFATPPPMTGCTLSVPAIGSMWPEYGSCLTSGRLSTPTTVPSWPLTPWGVGVADVRATYRMRGGQFTIANRGRVKLVAMAGVRNGGAAYLEASHATGLVRLAWNDDSASVRITNSEGAAATVVYLPRRDGSLLEATVEYISDTRVQVYLSVDSSSVSSTTTVPAEVTTQPLVDARIVGAGAGGGFQVAFPTSRTESVADWTPSAVLHLRTSNRNRIMVLPPVAGQNCADLLRDQAHAECATYWIDELGVLHWWDLARLESQSNQATLTSDEDIDDSGFTWSHDWSSVNSRAVVQWQEPLRVWSSRAIVDLWQGSGRTLHPGEDPSEEWIKVPDDEVWIMPDLQLRTAGSGTIDDFNRGVGSWFGGLVPGDSGDLDQWAHTVGALSVELEKVTDTTFKLNANWQGPAIATMRTPDGESAPALSRSRRDFDLPILRGKGRYTLASVETVSTLSGPPTAPEHVIDAQWWIQESGQAQYSADYAARRLTVPQPRLSSIAIIPTPGLQLGDVVTVVDSHVTRLTVRGVIVSDTKIIESDYSMRHAIAIRPTHISFNGPTWQQWADAAGNREWAEWGSENTPVRWREWAANPLGGTDA